MMFRCIVKSNIKLIIWDGLSMYLEKPKQLIIWEDVSLVTLKITFNVLSSEALYFLHKLLIKISRHVDILNDVNLN